MIIVKDVFQLRFQPIMNDPNEKIIAHCTRISPTGSQTGTLVFQGDRLRFHCDPPALRSDFIPLHSISNVRFDGQQLTIWMPRQIHYQTERGSLRDIYLAIHQFLNKEDTNTLDFDDLLLFGNAQSKGDIGALHLTTTALKFYTDDASKHLNVPLQDIQEVKLKSGIFSLSCTVDIILNNETRSFQGPNANKLFGFLTAIGYGNGPKSIPLFFWECQYRAGLVDWEVLCILTDEALMVVPTNPYFGTLSGNGVLVPHSEVCQINYHSKSAQLTLLTGDVVNLSARQATNRFKKLAETLCSWQSPTLLIGNEHSNGIRHPYLKTVLASLGHKNYLLGACGLIRTDSPVILGWISLTNKELVFIPRNPQTPVERHRLTQICRNDEYDTPQHYLALRIDDVGVAFAMSGGEDYYDAFYQRFQPPRRYLKWSEFKGLLRKQIVKGHSGKIIKNTINIDGHFEADIPNGINIERENAQLLDMNDRIQIQFETSDGTYQFACNIERIGGVMGGLSSIIYFSPPKRAAFYNFRSSIRIDLNAFVTALRIDSENKRDVIRGQLRNVSEAGCGLEASTGLLLQESLLISFPSAGIPLEMVGQIVNIRPTKRSDYTLYGVQFTDNSPRNRRRINQFITQYQAADKQEDHLLSKG